MHLIWIHAVLLLLLGCGGGASHGSLSVDVQTGSGQTAEESEPRGGVVQASSELHAVSASAGTPSYTEASSERHYVQAVSSTLSVVSESSQHSVGNFIAK